jgi:hypothetical protein
VLIVADQTVYEDHKKYLNINDQNIIFQYMRMYFASFSYLNNLRYYNSLKNDPDLRITMTSVGFIFLTVKSFKEYFLAYFKLYIIYQEPISWTDPTVCGFSNMPTNSAGKVVIDGSCSLRKFGEYVNKLSLSYNVDDAIGVYKFVISCFKL